ncbi:Hypothetical predicted protein [Octopus vulgaris]|uniref:Uncharacterized protein n=1 Tax=Octopus vulgaris TaxID=6645 RepID=A0AA36F4W5_OCTVU|nr:Hypothetical predicted protein [Octopus vulgaris]
MLTVTERNQSLLNLVSAFRPVLVLVDEGQCGPWEESIAEAHERKLLGYEELGAEIREKGCICELFAFDAGCRSFPVASLRMFLKVAGVSAARRIIKECGETAVEGSAWITRRFLKAYKTTKLA